MNARLPLTLLVLAAVAAVPVAQAAAPRDTYERHRIRSLAAPEGMPGKRAQTDARLIVPAEWTRVGKRSASQLRVRGGHTSCHYTITFTTRLFVGPDGTSGAVAAQRLPGKGPYLLDSGTRGSAAWRVVRDAGSRGRVRMRAIRVDASSAAGPRPAGEGRLWREIAAVAESGPNDECHSGTYRETFGPGIGDVLATARGRGYVL